MPVGWPVVFGIKASLMSDLCVGVGEVGSVDRVFAGVRELCNR